MTPPPTVWSFKDARIVLPARALASGGQAMAMITLVLSIHDSGAGPLGITGLMLAMTIPAIAFMGVAGHVADSVDSRTVLVTSGLAQVLCIVALTVASGLAPTFALAAAFSAASVFSSPVWSALVPRIVGDELIGKAISWQQGLSATVSPFAGALAGVAYGAWGRTTPLAISAALTLTLVAAAVSVRTRRGGRHDEALAGEDTSGAARVGLGIIRRDGLLFPLFVGLFVIVLALEGVNVVEVFLARDELGASPAEYGLSELFFGAGSIAGAALAGRFTSNGARARAGAVGFGVAGLSIVASGLAPAFWVYLVLATGIGGAAAISNAAVGALLMSRVPDAHRGKVGAALNGTMRIASVAALGLGGIDGAALGPRLTFIGGGALSAVAALVALLSLRPALRAEPELTADPAAPSGPRPARR